MRTLSIESRLQKLLDSEINLSQNHVSHGSRSHVYIRDLLVNRRNTDSSFPWLLDGDFLSGSYARGTKLHPLDDIDVMMVLDGAGLIPVGLDSQYYIRGNSDNNHGPIHNHLGFDNLIDSISVLNTFHQSLKKSHPDSTIRKDKQSVNVQLTSYNLGIDIVPCFHIVPYNDDQKDFYYIPKGDNDPGWLKTNPKIDANISTGLHDRHNKKLKSIVKLLKYWNRIKNNDRIRSYHLETITWHVFHNHESSVTQISDGIKYFFDNAEAYLKDRLQEATGFGKYIDDYILATDRQLSISALINAKNALQLHHILPSIESWKRVFGDKFAQ
jgi:hypothetical protein